MPQSLILNLLTQSAIPTTALGEEALQLLFWQLLDIVDPELGYALKHDRHSPAYSLSALQIEQPAVNKAIAPSSKRPARSRYRAAASNLRRFPPQVEAQTIHLQCAHTEAIAPGTSCWLRLSLLDDDLFEPLAYTWQQLSHEVFALGPGQIKVTRVDAERPGLDWAASCSYNDLYEYASERDRDIHFTFMTPAAFEAQGHITPLPTAAAIFNPLRKSWNRYSGLAFTPNLMQAIVPTAFNLQTQTIPQSSQHLPTAHPLEPRVGCTGRISFQISDAADPLTIKHINTLADFARYCPVGCYTRQGMGIIRRFNTAVIPLHQRHSN